LGAGFEKGQTDSWDLGHSPGHQLVFTNFNTEDGLSRYWVTV